MDSFGSFTIDSLNITFTEINSPFCLICTDTWNYTLNMKYRKMRSS